ncbi:DUF2076 domain-containing protein [Silvibacterium dinghuense]|uniref:DUF2076 domain-containing protein n=1 Tax=Silvibacterium dinghuense TaxID=1560006 RepID=A0A4Q1SGL3_9BACT|nr:DUF2076 domain-containing protein [Silvibacterium dinghuense]RXS96668.1 DUF2076 domain-containing protein [Silvibacterium dinghuense]GGG92685.1 ABC transporter substrate-binding protein [Silvibacterium dinghuense]
MTPQEAQMLHDLVGKVQSTQLTEKDHDAEALLKDGLARDPDALYKLAQTVLIQNMAIEQLQEQAQQMQEQIEQLQAEEDELRQQVARPQPAKATSFLGSLLGRRDPAPPPQQYAPPQYQSVPPQYAAAPPSGYAPAPGYGPGYVQGPGYAPAPSAGGSFLRSAATTAAGVAAGALAFEGIESLMHGGERGFGGGYGGGYGAPPVEETIINNNYGDDSGRYAEHREQEAGYDDRASGPDEQPQGPYDNAGAQDVSYDDSNFGTDDDNFSNDDNFGNDDNFA